MQTKKDENFVMLTMKEVKELMESMIVALAQTQLVLEGAKE